jgi:hypothetical protein
MANARIVCPEFPLVAGTNLLGKVGQHKFIKGITDGTVKTGSVVTIAPTTRVLTIATATNKPAGVVVYRTTYNWGSTTPARNATLPANIEVDVCFDGPIEALSDVSEIDDVMYFGVAVACKATGLIEIPFTAGQFPVGYLIDLRAGNTGTGTGGADGDPIGIMVRLGGPAFA